MRTRSWQLGWLALGVVALGATILGWRVFWHLTDDGFIFFRYAHTAVHGRGRVWNPPPFRPVEGYTSWLWLQLLVLSWKVLGIEPPVSANWLSLGFGCGSLALTLVMVRRLTWGAAEGLRLALATIVLTGIVSNRTFLAWLSSGLETALFNFLLVWWVLEVTAAPERRGPGWAVRAGGAATSTALARPDGLLFCAATMALILWVTARDGRRWRLVGLLPFILVLAHLLWRHATYGEWLPNTYYAKQRDPWPGSGLRYLASFALEYGLWLWALLAAAWAVSRLRRSGLARTAGLLLDHRAGHLVACGALFAHLGYYTILIGGDHFEYRVYSHLVPLTWLTALAFVMALSARAGVRLGLLLALLFVSLPIPWMHWHATRGLTTRAHTVRLVKPVAPLLPPPFSWLAIPWDETQAWLIDHNVGVRHQELKVFWLNQLRILPSREEGLRQGWEERSVVRAGSIGVLGWVLPNAAIIDTLGLTDRVVARNPPYRFTKRQMAHDRQPPHNYVDCFRPNVNGDRGKLHFRNRPLITDAEIRRCESRSWPP